ncbi:uncharacterized protein K460DRAFT_196161 [Cucurbitaria berberidis CBS 394.84]|uniref:Uncharacterized protein n=1 Tax=Cucurbitaria berberidis CBS 394.84 TaxID=1168544 RepID=A0A9P4G8I1_9PLEO|nr:uncharacterized protein K460DRAFT_196161 [Cucurbitaria berberidis CBS 394.84]KAF1840992.1 hypothetical protein K460DRAFT_196161 [Cucurbitaria berberidis CBS 394.84]
MHIQIESRSGWRFTVTSSDHNVVKETTRPRTKSFVNYDSKKTSTVGDEPPTPKLTSKVSRRRSFRKRVGRFLVHFRMHPEDTAFTNCDASDLLPPYEHRQEHYELPADSLLQELPDFIPEIFGEYSFELGCHDEHHVEYSPMDYVNHQSAPSWSQVPNKRSYPTIGYAIPPASQSIATPVYNPSPNTAYQLCALPGIIRGGQSDNSSPVSPFTPKLEVGLGTQQQSDSGFSNGNVSPHDSISPVVHQYATDGAVYQEMQGYPYCPTLTTPARAYSTVLPASPTPTTDNDSFNYQHYTNLHSTSSSSFRNLTPYLQPSQESLTSQQSIPNPETPWFDYEDHRPDSWENIGSARARQMIQEPGMIDRDNINHWSQGIVPDERHSLALSPTELCGHETVLTNNYPNEDTTLEYPPMVCNDCGTEFHGKYADLLRTSLQSRHSLTLYNRYRQGNLRRHVRETHSLLKSAVGKACRVCKQVYNRTDAKRKHEWKKHRLPDAKPNKRAKLMIPVATY